MVVLLFFTPFFWPRRVSFFQQMAKVVGACLLVIGQSFTSSSGAIMCLQWWARPNLHNLSSLIRTFAQDAGSCLEPRDNMLWPLFFLPPLKRSMGRKRAKPKRSFHSIFSLLKAKGLIRVVLSLPLAKIKEGRGKSWFSPPSFVWIDRFEEDHDRAVLKRKLKPPIQLLCRWQTLAFSVRFTSGIPSCSLSLSHLFFFSFNRKLTSCSSGQPVIDVQLVDVSVQKYEIFRFYLLEKWAKCDISIYYFLYSSRQIYESAVRHCQGNVRWLWQVHFIQSVQFIRERKECRLGKLILHKLKCQWHSFQISWFLGSLLRAAVLFCC